MLLVLLFLVCLSSVFVWNSLSSLVQRPLQPQMLPVQGYFQSSDSSSKDAILEAMKSKEHWKYPVIDAVYTWVNGSDPNWLKEKAKYHLEFIAKLTGKDVAQVAEEAARDTTGSANGDNRYRDHNEIVFSLRSLVKHAPWIRYIHIVVADGQRPNWLAENLNHSKIRIVPHSSIFQNLAHLPTFNSDAIESQIDNIPDLSEYFLYFNDDFFLGKPIHQEDFLTSVYDGNQRIFFDFWASLKTCHKDCTLEMMGDGKCDTACNAPQCNFDMGDCGIEAQTRGWAKYDDAQKNAVFHPSSGDFVATLRYVDLVFNRKLGKTDLKMQRPPIAHVPYFMNKGLYRDLKQRFHHEYELTASHRFRHGQDMQLSFSYNHYFIHSKVYAPTEQQLWRAAILTAGDDQEFLYGGKMNQTNKYEQAKKDLIQGSSSYAEVRRCAVALKGGWMDHLNAPFLQRCSRAMKKLHGEYNIRLPIDRIVVQDIKEVDFQCLGDNEERSIGILKRIATKAKKFVCIEDDMKKYHPNVEKAYMDMYHALFPTPANFEVKI